MASRDFGSDYEAVFMPYYGDDEGVWTLGFDALGKYYDPIPADAVLVQGENIVENETSFSVDYFGTTINVVDGVVQGDVTFAQIPAPSPIPVEGDVQVFLDPECTQYATGEVEKVYVRINTPWSGVESGWDVTNQTGSVIFSALSPTTEYPSDPYGFNLWVDFSAEKAEPYNAGEVVEVGLGSTFDVTGFTTVFSKP